MVREEEEEEGEGEGEERKKEKTRKNQGSTHLQSQYAITPGTHPSFHFSSSFSSFLSLRLFSPSKHNKCLPKVDCLGDPQAWGKC